MLAPRLGRNREKPAGTQLGDSRVEFDDDRLYAARLLGGIELHGLSMNYRGQIMLMARTVLTVEGGGLG